jgi:hypothetical protein
MGVQARVTVSPAIDSKLDVTVLDIYHSHSWIPPYQITIGFNRSLFSTERQ